MWLDAKQRPQKHCHVRVLAPGDAWPSDGRGTQMGEGPKCVYFQQELLMKSSAGDQKLTL